MNVSDMFELVRPYKGESSRWFMRGEARPYPQPCLPKFARDYLQVPGYSVPSKQISDLTLVEPLGKDSTGAEVILSCLTTQEVDILRDFQKNAPQDEFYERMVESDEDHPGWLSFAQHYGRSTRLVDVSYNPLVALYFACQEPDDKPGTVWFYPSLVDAHGTCPPTSIFDVFEPAIHDRRAIDWHKDGRLSKYETTQSSLGGLIESQFLFDFAAPNKRVIAQSGKFIWSGSPLKPLQRNSFGVEIEPEYKTTIRAEIAAFGMNEESLFPV